MKTQRLREKVLAEIAQSRQTTFDNLPSREQSGNQAETQTSKKQIIITDVASAAGEDELAVKIGFRLVPSKAAFSKITLELYFDREKFYSTPISIPQSKLATDDFEFPRVLDMKGIAAGFHVINVEMFELWSSGEKLSATSREVTIITFP